MNIITADFLITYVLLRQKLKSTVSKENQCPAQWSPANAVARMSSHAAESKSPSKVYSNSCVPPLQPQVRMFSRKITSSHTYPHLLWFNLFLGQVPVTLSIVLPQDSLAKKPLHNLKCSRVVDKCNFVDLTLENSNLFVMLKNFYYEKEYFLR